MTEHNPAVRRDLRAAWQDMVKAEVAMATGVSVVALISGVAWLVAVSGVAWLAAVSGVAGGSGPTRLRCSS